MRDKGSIKSINAAFARFARASFPWAAIAVLAGVCVSVALAAFEPRKAAAHMPVVAIGSQEWHPWWWLILLAACGFAALVLGMWQYRKLWLKREQTAFELALAAKKMAFERRLRLATEGADVGAWEWDMESGRLEWSEKCRIHLALPEGREPDFDRFYAAVHPDDRDRVKRAIEEAVEKRKDFHAEYRVVGPGGSVRWIAAPGRVYVRPDGSLEAMSGLTIDITRLEHTEECLRDLAANLEKKVAQRTAELRSSQERLSKTVEHAAIGICLNAPDGRFLEVNPALCVFLGRDAAQLLSSSWQDFTHPEDVKKGLDLVARMNTGEIQTCTIRKRYLRPDGSVVWGLLSMSCLRKNDGRIVDFVYIEANEAACRYNKRSRKQMIGKSLRELLPSTVSSGLFARICEVLETGRPFALDDFCYDHEIQGQRRWFDVRCVRVGDRLSLLRRDVLERHQAAQDLADSRKGFQLLAENASDVVLEIDAGGFVTDASPSSLLSLAGACAPHLREVDILARVGGEEFAILLPDTALAKTQVARPEGKPLSFTVSVGVAEHEGAKEEMRELLKRADLALYRAKNGGRDMVCAA